MRPFQGLCRGPARGGLFPQSILVHLEVPQSHRPSLTEAPCFVGAEPGRWEGTVPDLSGLLSGIHTREKTFSSLLPPRGNVDSS